MTKRRKSLKPVARGVATVSIPKKPVPPEELQDIPEGAEGTSGEQSSDVPTASTVPPRTDQEILHESALQAIVEKFQEKTEKDVLRNIKVWCPSVE